MSTLLKKISELATVIAGFSPKPAERKRRGHYLLLGGRNIKDGKLVTTDADSYVDVIDRESFRRAIALPGDIVVSTLFDRRKLYVYSEDAPAAVVNSSCAIIRSGEQSDYISSYLRMIEVNGIFWTKPARQPGEHLFPGYRSRTLPTSEYPYCRFQSWRGLAMHELRTPQLASSLS